MSREEGFLARWSRRKREAGPEPEPAAEPLPLPEGAPAPAPPPAEAAEEPVPTRPPCPIAEVPQIDPASLPPVEALTASSDFSAFLRPGVPAVLRNAALRRMWSLDPAIRDYIGPVEYQWDFNTPGGLPFGFANELGGEVKKLLAQAIGQLGEEEERAAAREAAGGTAPEVQAEILAPAEAPVEIAAPAEAERDAVAAALPEPEADGPAPGPARRRHGGALPA